MSLSRYFTHRDEPIDRWGETGVPRKNHLTHPQAELVLSHMWPVRGSNLHQTQRRDDRMIKSAEIQRPYPLGHRGRLVALDYQQIFLQKTNTHLAPIYTSAYNCIKEEYQLSETMKLGYITCQYKKGKLDELKQLETYFSIKLRL